VCMCIYAHIYIYERVRSERSDNVGNKAKRQLNPLAYVKRSDY